GGDRLSLDAEFPATELTDDDREKLWGLAPGSGVEPSLSDLRNRLVPSVLPQFPSGNRLPGGELHMAVLRPEALAGTGEPPRLLRVWPEGAARLDGSSDRDRRQWASFLRHPRVELTVDRPIAAEALAEPGAWVRLFAAVRDDGIRSFRRVELEPGEIAESSPPEHDGAVTYRFRLAETLFDADDGQCRAVAVLLQVRSADAFVPPPVGADAPNLLLDADFAGTGLDKQTLFTIWQGGQPAHWIAELAPRTTDGATLCDGTPGGFVHTAFTVAAP
ncbi:MAG TPA: hypothetical protein VLH10_03265, partial [Yinghuangia sp.]|nr:hypothetical protein [Yinghuangia sp.]